MDIFDQNFLTNYLIKDYKTFNDFVDFLKVLQPLMTTARGMWALLTSCYIDCINQPFLHTILRTSGSI